MELVYVICKGKLEELTRQEQPLTPNIHADVGNPSWPLRVVVNKLKSRVKTRKCVIFLSPWKLDVKLFQKWAVKAPHKDQWFFSVLKKSRLFHIPCLFLGGGGEFVRRRNRRKPLNSALIWCVINQCYLTESKKFYLWRGGGGEKRGALENSRLKPKLSLLYPQPIPCPVQCPVARYHVVLTLHPVQDHNKPNQHASSTVKGLIIIVQETSWSWELEEEREKKNQGTSLHTH